MSNGLNIKEDALEYVEEENKEKKATKWTEDQRAAIEARGNNLLVAAAAGSGKTAVLVQRIIERIEEEKPGFDIDKLLVVTFTNAAAAEMRERIGEAIGKALDKNPKSKNLQRQLTLLNKASITTIHSFCLEVIRNHFHRIELDPNFRIGDETENSLLKLEALEELFEKRYEEDYVEQSFLELVECYGSSREDLPLQEIVVNLYEFAQSSPWPREWLQKSAEAFLIDENFKFGNSPWAEVLLEQMKIEFTGLVEKIKDALIKIETAEGLEPYLINFQEDLGNIENIKKLCSEKKWDDFFTAFQSITFSTLKRCGKEVDKKAQEDVKQVREEVKKKVKKIKEDILHSDEDTLKEEFKVLYPLMKCLSQLVIEFEEVYSKLKREKGIIDFNDIEHFCLQILTVVREDGTMVPSEVALALRNKYEEILIDEYQDSNLIQEALLQSISRKDTEEPNTFMVGDVKQSIYRFRQAKPELFLEKYNRYSKDKSEKNRKILLYKNFRSRKEIIDGVNYIFRQVMSKTLGELDYTKEEELNLGAFYVNPIENENFGGPVEVHILEKNAAKGEFESKEEKESSLEASENEEGIIKEEEDLDGIQLEARLVAKRIQELIAPSKGTPFQVLDKSSNGYRNIEFKDIVILLRATSKWAPVFQEELEVCQIPVYADAGTGYFDTMEIKTVMALLQTIDNPMQDIPLLSVLKSPIGGFSSEELIDIRMQGEEQSIYECMKEIVKRESCTQSEENVNNTVDKSVDNVDKVKKEEFEVVNSGQNEGEVSECIVDKKNVDKVDRFLENLNLWREKSLYLSLDEFIWYLYRETGYYNYVGAMPLGVQRQANLRILFERAKKYEETSFKGLFNFINFIQKLKVSSGDMGSAKILGENENVVRIMSIHKSKGLEFPVVILAGTGKQFNLRDITRSILYHHSLGYGPDFVQYKKRIFYSTVVKEALKIKIKRESLSEEMRILYVAFTRAKEKLIITGTVKEIESAVKKWRFPLGRKEEQLPVYEVMKGRTYLDWIVPAVMRHKEAGVLREVLQQDGYEEKGCLEDSSRWKVILWTRDEIALYHGKEKIEEEKKEEGVEGYTKYKNEIYHRLNWKYPYSEAIHLPTKLSVTEIKRRFNLQSIDQSESSLFGISLQKKPLFLEETKGLSGAEKGTVLHLVMQHVPLNKEKNEVVAPTSIEIKELVAEMVVRELLTEEQAKTVKISKIVDFFNSNIGSRLRKAQQVQREVPFHIQLKATDLYKELPLDIYKEETLLLQGIMDCYFEEEGELVLLDYKTDYMEEGKEEEVKEKYRIQIEYYTMALERITGKRVKEKYLYLIHQGDFISYEKKE